MQFYKLIFIDFIVIFSLILTANIFEYNFKINKYYITYPNLHYYFNNYTNKVEFLNLFGQADKNNKIKVNEKLTEYFIFISLQKWNEKKLLDQFFYDNKLSLFENDNSKSIVNIYTMNEINKVDLKKNISNQLLKIIKKIRFITISDNLYNYYTYKNQLVIERANLRYLDENHLRISNIDLGYEIPIQCNLADKRKCNCMRQEINIEILSDILVINLVKIFSLVIFFIYVFLRLLFDLKKRKK